MDRPKSDMSAAAAAVDSRKAADRAAAVKLRQMLSKLPHALNGTFLTASHPSRTSETRSIIECL